MQTFINELPEESSGDHIEPYEHYTCEECEGAIEIIIHEDTPYWQHVLDAPHDHDATPVEGTLDMFPADVIANVVAIALEVYHD